MKIQKLSKLASRLLFSLTLLTLFLSGLALAEEYKAWVYTKLPDTPEGVCIDSQGTLYATLFHTNRVVKLERDGTWMHVAWVPSERESGKGDLMGIEADKYDNLYVAYKQSSKFDNLFDPQHAACHDVSVTKSGVYKIDGKTREVTAIATRADGWPCCMPDDVDIDDAGNIYVSDLTYSCIWKITPDRKVTLWSAHRLLNWSNPPYSGVPLGVNVLVLDKEQRNIYAGTDGDPMLLRFPIKEDGSAGEPVIISSGHGVIDGIELDEEGNIYISEILRNEISVISPDGSQRYVIASKLNAPLDNNTSLVLRDGVLYTANLGFMHRSPAEADKTVVAIKGFPKPKK